MKLTQATAKAFAVKTATVMTEIRPVNGSICVYLCWGDCPR